MSETNDEIILENVGDADNIAHRVGIIYAHFMKFAYLPANIMSNSWVNTIWNQSQALFKCKSISEWNKAEPLFYTKMKKRAFDEYNKDNDPSTAEAAFNIVLNKWTTINQFKNGGPDTRDYIISFADRARRTDISNYIKSKDWTRFSR